jgi:hypothetical protein
MLNRWTDLSNFERALYNAFSKVIDPDRDH